MTLLEFDEAEEEKMIRNRVWRKHAFLVASLCCLLSAVTRSAAKAGPTTHECHQVVLGKSYRTRSGKLGPTSTRLRG